MHRLNEIPDDTDFWKGIVYKDGKLDEEQVMKELSDYSYVMQQVSMVYCEITDNRMSKPLYHADDVIGEYGECNYNKRWTQEDMVEILARATSHKSLRKEIMDYFDIDHPLKQGWRSRSRGRTSDE